MLQPAPSASGDAGGGWPLQTHGLNYADQTAGPGVTDLPPSPHPLHPFLQLLLDVQLSGPWRNRDGVPARGRWRPPSSHAARLSKH